MKKWLFWNDWYKSDRYVFLFFLCVVLATLFYLVFSIFTGVDNVIHWEVIENLERLKTDVYAFRLGNLELKIPLDNYIIFQYFQGSDLTIQPVHAYIYLIILVISINLVMAILPSLNKFWFYAGMGGFTGFMVLFNFGQINLFNQSDKSALIIILGFYLTVSYFYREFKPDIAIFKRFLVFTALSAIIAVIFYFYSGVERPFLYLANNGIYAPLIVSIIFILSVAHEIIYGFVYLTTSASTPDSKNSLAHFTFISLIYIFYSIITYLYLSRQIQWEIIYLNPFLILIIASVIGLWSFRKREELYSEIFPFYPVGALFYLGFAAITLATIAYAFSNGNDPMIEAFEDAIMYSQIGFSILFFIYVIANFGPMIAKNFRVVKIVYQSRIFPFFVFRIGGVIAAGFLFFQAEFFPYYQILAGYYNQVGDLYLIEGQLDLAREYYERASDYEYQNHRSNYAMATIGRMQKDKLDEVYYFENSLLKRPTDYAYVNLGDIYLRNNQYFEGLFRLKEGQEEFPYSQQILNNLGYFYSKTDIIDTAFYYFNLANNAARDHAIPEANIYGLMAKSELFISPDSLESYFEHRDLIADINRQAILNQLNRYDSSLLQKNIDTIQNDVDFAALYNSGLNALQTEDTIYFNQISNYGHKSGNSFYRNRLDILEAIHDYLIHQTASAFFTLKNYAVTSLNNHEYYRLLGKLTLMKDNPVLAVEFFKSTNIELDVKDRFHLSLALMEAGDHEEARSLLQTLTESDDPDIAFIASEFISVLTYREDLPMDFSDDEFVYLLFHYHPHFQQDTIVVQLMDKIKNPEIRDLMRLEYMEHLIERKEHDKARKLFSETGLPWKNPQLKDGFLKIAYLLDLQMSENPVFIPETGNLKMTDRNYLYDVLLEALRKLENNDTTDLEQMFHRLGTWDPFFERGILEATEYYHKIRKDDYFAYDLLIQATVTNPYSIALYQKLVELSLDMGLIEYAQDALEILQNLLPENEFSSYRQDISSRIMEKKDITGF